MEVVDIFHSDVLWLKEGTKQSSQQEGLRVVCIALTCRRANQAALIKGLMKLESKYGTPTQILIKGHILLAMMSKNGQRAGTCYGLSTCHTILLLQI